MSIDAGRSFHIPESWGLGIKNDVRTRFGVQQAHNTTFVIDETGAVQSRLQDNGRQAFTPSRPQPPRRTIVFEDNDELDVPDFLK